jgi:hypothetical protein
MNRIGGGELRDQAVRINTWPRKRVSHVERAYVILKLLPNGMTPLNTFRSRSDEVGHRGSFMYGETYIHL